jgi:hypothetical protein
MSKMRGLKIDYPKSDRKSTASRDGVLRRTTQTQPIQGEVFGIFKIIGESPKRNTRGSLAWDCECIAAGHPIQIEHAVLAYGATPAHCRVCAAEERNKKFVEEAQAKEIVREAVAEMRAARLAQEQERIEHGTTN